MITKSGTKIWKDIYNKPTDSKRHVSFTSNHPRRCLINVPFSLARRISTTFDNENVKEKCSKNNIAKPKIPQVANTS